MGWGYEHRGREFQSEVAVYGKFQGQVSMGKTEENANVLYAYCLIWQLAATCGCRILAMWSMPHITMIVFWIFGV